MDRQAREDFDRMNPIDPPAKPPAEPTPRSSWLSDLSGLLTACEAWAEISRPNEDLIEYWPADERALYRAIRKIIP